MYDLSYFNLGFRSDSVCNLLSELQHKDIPANVILDDAFSIVKDCLKIGEENVLVSHFSSGKGYEIDTLFPVLAEVFLGKGVEEVVAELKAICKTIEAVRQNRTAVRETDYKRAIAFFSKLADLCLAKSTHQTVMGIPPV